MDANVPVRMFGAWAAVAINYKLEAASGIAVHSDSHDFRDGLCWTVPFGTFEGGNLSFPKLNLDLEYHEGDVAAFQSLQLHEVKPFQGTRYSLVFFLHNNLFQTYQSK
jgi:hypothetical protein